MHTRQMFSSFSALGLLWISLFSSSAQAYPLNPWGSQTPQGTVVLNPFLYVYSGPTFYPVVYGLTGIGESADVIAGAGGYVYVDGSGAGFDYVELMPRYWLSESLGLVLHVIYAAPGSDSYWGNSLTLAPEVHGVLGGDSFAFTYNVGWRPVLGFGENGGFQAGEITALLAPEWNFSSQFSVFLEVDPSFALGEGGGLGLTLVPGVGFALDEDQTHTFAVGAQVDTIPLPEEDFLQNNVSLGLWYSTAFGG